jgi:hypothetical protein
MAGATAGGTRMSIGVGGYGALRWGPGQPYSVVSLEGLRDMPGVRARDLPRSERHGSVSLPDFAEMKVLVLTLGLSGDDHAELQTLSEAVRQATPPAAAPGVLLVRDDTRMYYAKPRRRALPEDNEYLWRLGQAVIEFACPDPREYEANATVSTVSLPSSGSSGMGFPTGFPFGFGSGGVGGDVSLLNSGNVDTPLSLRINGPVTNPVVSVNGVALSLSIDVAAGDYLLIDTESGTVLLNGSAGRRSAVVDGSRFPLAPPGVSTLQYRAASAFDAAATLAVTYRGAWL